MLHSGHPETMVIGEKILTGYDDLFFPGASCGKKVLKTGKAIE